MSKKGFTLVELLLVLVLVSVISVSAVVVFEQTKDNVSVEEEINMYLDLQRASKIYLDLNDSWARAFNENDEVYISVGELKSKNYINTSLKRDINDYELPDHYLVKVYITDNGNGYVDTCILNITDTGSECISDSDGNIKPGSCCNK